MVVIDGAYGPFLLKNMLGRPRLRVVAHQTVPYNTHEQHDIVFRDLYKAHEWIDNYLSLPNRKVVVFIDDRASARCPKWRLLGKAQRSTP